jgi:hypothetical protein
VNKKPLKYELLRQELNRGNFNAMAGPHHTPPFSEFAQKGDAEMKD